MKYKETTLFNIWMHFQEHIFVFGFAFGKYKINLTYFIFNIEKLDFKLFESFSFNIHTRLYYFDFLF